MKLLFPQAAADCPVGLTLASIVFPVPGGPDSSTPLVSLSRWLAAHVVSVSGLITLCFCMRRRSRLLRIRHGRSPC